MKTRIEYIDTLKFVAIFAVIAIIILAAYFAMYYMFGTLLTEDESIQGWKNSALVDEFGNTIVLEDQNTKKKPGVQ